MWNNPFGSKKEEVASPAPVSLETKQGDSVLEQARNEFEKLGTSIGTSFRKLQSYIDSGKELIPSPSLATKLTITLPALMFLISLNADAQTPSGTPAYSGLWKPAATTVSQVPGQAPEKTQQQKAAEAAAWTNFGVAIVNTGLGVAGQMTNDVETKQALATTQVVLNTANGVYQTATRVATGNQAGGIYNAGVSGLWK